jgi:Tol biopolymer transport system component
VQRLAGLITLAAVLALPAAGAANPPQIAFKLFPGDRQAIVRLDQTGGNLIELTRDRPKPSEFGGFSWSPDGSRLVYSTDNPSTSGGDLHSVSAEGTDPARLTFNGRNDHPAWSPTRGRIAFVHTGVDYLHQEIWIVAPDGSNPRPLTSDAGEKTAPRWSPDGSRVLYGRHETGSYWIRVADGDSGQLIFQAPGFSGTWSPDGSRIAVSSGGAIDVLNADGTGGRHTVAQNAGGPEWSPDGSRITFFRTRCARIFRGICGTVLGSVYVVGADGQGQRRLTGPISGGAGSTVEGFPNDESKEPSWWPDGSRLFYREGGFMRVMNADGTCEQRFGPRGLNMFLGNPAWRPGSTPFLPALHCVDLRVRAVPARRRFARRGNALVHMVVENDGTETATGITLTIRLQQGRSRIRPLFSPCSGRRIVSCRLDPLAPGQSRALRVLVLRPRPHAFSLRAQATAQESDSEPGTNIAGALAEVLDCDVVGSERPDRLAGTSGRDKICGLGGADVIAGGGGRDTILAGSGNDRIYARDGRRDVIDCDTGRDRVVADRVDRVAPNCERRS